MKKYIITCTIIVLGILGYFGQDIYHSNQLRSQLMDSINESNESFIQQHKTALLKYQNINLNEESLRTFYDTTFNNGSWNIVELHEHANEYVLLFDEMPKITSGKVLLTLDLYLLEYYIEELYGKEFISKELLTYDDLQSLIGDITANDSRHIFETYYDSVMSLYMDGRMTNDDLLAFHDSCDVYINLLNLDKKELYSNSFLRLNNKFSNYKTYETVFRNFTKLTTQIETQDYYAPLYDAMKELLKEMSTSIAPTYTIDGLSFDAGSNNNVYLVPGKFLTFNWLQHFDPATAKNEFVDYLEKEKTIDTCTLEANELYYIVSTNDYMKICQVEILYTFDGDYSQFVHIDDSRKVLKKRIEELNLGNFLEANYNIRYLSQTSDVVEAEYGRIIDEVLDNYTDIVKPIIITNKVNHFFTIDDGRYFAEFEDLFEPIFEISDISFFIVDEITSDYFYVEGLAMTEGILIPVHNMSRTDDAKNIVHHELMHQIERFYSYRFDIDIQLYSGDFDYLDDRELSDQAYIDTILYENFSAENVFDRLEYGMTSYYSGINMSEHLAELWSDLITDYEQYDKQIKNFDRFDKNVQLLVDYINKIVKIVDGEKLEGVEDILRFNGY